MMENWQAAGFGVYVHWPFCAAKCPYCDFNSHVVAHVDQRQWQTTFVEEIAYWASAMDVRPRVGSVFFGGGTPSLMEPFVVEGILSALRTAFPFANDVEITLEANPTSVEAAKFGAFVGAGVNRFSIGIQALRDADLRALGRLHDVAQAKAAYDVARETGARVSFDLIYARQHQTADAWAEELAEALAMGPSHLSLYQLTIEAGTAFGDRAARGRLPGLPPEDRSVDLWDVTQTLTAQAGLRRYETSNHAAPDYEARHNLVYWRGGDWLGLGPGAHGRVSMAGRRTATTTLLQPGAWVSAPTRATAITQETLQTSDIIDEYVLGALRLADGVSLPRLAQLGGTFPCGTLASLCDDGLCQVRGEHLCLTDRGALLLNRVALELLSAET
ncbi:MAG: radical SAM family heme chaperone HemW [Pseudomonadota bacterium]